MPVELKWAIFLILGFIAIKYVLSDDNETPYDPDDHMYNQLDYLQIDLNDF